MPLQILVHGRPLDPAKAPGSFFPLDWFKVCPDCGSGHVRAGPPRTIDDLGAEFGAKQYHEMIPRKQDRWCLDCGARWTAILAPEFLAR